MTEEQANNLKVGDRVSIQRRKFPVLHYGTVVQAAGHSVGIQWESFIQNGEEYGDGLEYKQPEFMARVNLVEA
jgi:hypothetical protein